MKKVFIITGANRGLGKALVDLLIKNNNYFIISISRNESEEQKKLSPLNYYFLNADLSNNNVNKKITILKELIKDEPIYFINNASIIEPIAKIEFLKEKDIDNTISVNIKSTILITKYLLDNFKEQKLNFINISSGAANKAISNWSLYCSSKALSLIHM
jgi:benzil reductase ((S)-benzoin forming)